MLAFIREPVPPASRTNPTSDRSTLVDEDSVDAASDVLPALDVVVVVDRGDLDSEDT